MRSHDEIVKDLKAGLNNPLALPSTKASLEAALKLAAKIKEVQEYLKAN